MAATGRIEFFLDSGMGERIKQEKCHNKTARRKDFTNLTEIYPSSHTSSKIINKKSVREYKYSFEAKPEISTFDKALIKP